MLGTEVALRGSIRGRARQCPNLPRKDRCEPCDKRVAVPQLPSPGQCSACVAAELVFTEGCAEPPTTLHSGIHREPGWPRPRFRRRGRGGGRAGWRRAKPRSTSTPRPPLREGGNYISRKAAGCWGGRTHAQKAPPPPGSLGEESEDVSGWKAGSLQPGIGCARGGSEFRKEGGRGQEKQHGGGKRRRAAGDDGG